MTSVGKLEQWCKDNDVKDIKFFPSHFFGVKLFDGPDPTVEQLAEGAYRLLTGETTVKQLDPSDY